MPPVSYPIHAYMLTPGDLIPDELHEAATRGADWALRRYQSQPVPPEPMPSVYSVDARVMWSPRDHNNKPVTRPLLVVRIVMPTAPNGATWMARSPADPNYLADIRGHFWPPARPLSALDLQLGAYDSTNDLLASMATLYAAGDLLAPSVWMG